MGASRGVDRSRRGAAGLPRQLTHSLTRRCSSTAVARSRLLRSDRVVKHEAGHFLIAYLMGVLPKASLVTRGRTRGGATPLPHPPNSVSAPATRKSIDLGAPLRIAMRAKPGSERTALPTSWPRPPASTRAPTQPCTHPRTHPPTRPGVHPHLRGGPLAVRGAQRAGATIREVVRREISLSVLLLLSFRCSGAAVVFVCPRCVAGCEGGGLFRRSSDGVVLRR